MSSNPLYGGDKAAPEASPWKESPPAYAEIDEPSELDNYAAIDVNPNTRYAALDDQGYQAPSASRFLSLEGDNYLAPQPIADGEYETPTGFGMEETYEYAETPQQDATYAEATMGFPDETGPDEDSEYAEPDAPPSAQGPLYDFAGQEDTPLGHVTLLSKLCVSSLSKHAWSHVSFSYWSNCSFSSCGQPLATRR
jgi:hypothetical protein